MELAQPEKNNLDDDEQGVVFHVPYFPPISKNIYFTFPFLQLL